MKKRKYNWDEIDLEYEKNGMTAYQFSQSKGIPCGTYLGHLQRKAKKELTTETPEVVPIQVIPESNKRINVDMASKKSVINISYNNFKITLTDSFDKQLLKDTLEVLSSIC